jgi:hypothetical protein
VFAEQELAHDVKLEVGGYDVIKRYVELGLGISIVMSHCLTGADQLHTAPLRRYFPTRTYGVVLRKGKTLSPAAARFVETMRADTSAAEGGKRRKGDAAQSNGTSQIAGSSQNMGVSQNSGSSHNISSSNRIGSATARSKSASK